MAEVYYVSLKPSDAVAGGAMVPEGSHDIVEAKFEPWDYNGTVVPAVPALHIGYKDISSGQVYHQYYSAGPASSMEPTDDGKRLASKTPRGLNLSTNCYAVLKSAVDSGLPEAKITDDISVIVGARVKVVHEEAPEREIGGKKVAKRMIPVISEIISMPDQTKAKPAAKAATKKTNGAEEPPSDLKAKAEETLIRVLKAAPNGFIHVKDIGRGIYNSMPASDGDRNTIVNTVVTPPTFQFLKDMAPKGVIYDAEKATVMYVGD